MKETATATLPGKVEKIVKTPLPEKAHIDVEGTHGDHKKLSIENTLKEKDGQEVHLHQGQKVEVKVKTEPDPIRFGR
jgi:hypothetical protein